LDAQEHPYYKAHAKQQPKYHGPCNLQASAARAHRYTRSAVVIFIVNLIVEGISIAVEGSEEVNLAVLNESSILLSVHLLDYTVA
jgi:hypothetical protein